MEGVVGEVVEHLNPLAPPFHLELDVEGVIGEVVAPGEEQGTSVGPVEGHDG